MVLRVKTNGVGRRVAIINDTAMAENHHGCFAVMAALRNGLVRHGLEITGTVPLRQDWREQPYRRAIESADLIVVNGEGSVHSARPWVKRMLSAAEVARRESKPCALINSVYHDNDQETAGLVGAFDLVTLRETMSQRELAAAGVAGEVVPDLSFAETVPVAASARRWRRRYARPYALFTDSVQPEVSAAVRKRLASTPDYSEISVRRPHGRLPTVVAREARREFRYIRRPDVFANESLFATLRTIAGSTRIVSGRFHFVCFALALARPFCAIRSNSHKIEGLLADAGLAEFEIEPGRVAEPEALPAWSAGAGEAALAYAERAHTAIEALFDRLASLAAQA